MTSPVPLHNYAPLGLNREDAAAYIGVGPTKFDEMVADCRMPTPHTIDRRQLWDRDEIQTAFRELPRIEEKEKENPWDKELAS